MPAESTDRNPTLALSTKVEEDFVSPLTAIRGSLEILRDFEDLTAAERSRFIENALSACRRLEIGVEQLATSVYAAGQKHLHDDEEDNAEAETDEFCERVSFLEGMDIVEIDFSNFEFDSSDTVNAFYDRIEKLINATGRDWYILVNFEECRIWPEAWVAFAHRGKKIRTVCSLGTVRYDGGTSGTYGADPDLLPDKDSALARIEGLKLSRG